MHLCELRQYRLGFSAGLHKSHAGRNLVLRFPHFQRHGFGVRRRPEDGVDEAFRRRRRRSGCFSLLEALAVAVCVVLYVDASALPLAFKDFPVGGGGLGCVREARKKQDRDGRV